MSQINRLRDAEISNGNLINADDIDAELNQLVAAHNGNDTVLTDISSGTYTFAGVKTFSSSPKMNGIDERTAGSGVTVDSVLLKDGMVKVTGTPTDDGQIGYSGNQFLLRENGTNKTLSSFYSSVSSISSNSTVGTSSGQLLLCTNFITLSLPAEASLEDTWVCHVANTGTGLTTIDPNGAETIDGAATLKLYPGESCTILNSGTGTFNTIGRVRQREVLVFSQAASNSTVIDFTGLDSGEFTDFKFELKNIIPASTANSLYMRFSTNGGSSYASGASDYNYEGKYVDSTGAESQFSSSGTTQIAIMVPTLLGNGTGQSYSGTVRLTDPLNTSVYKSVIVSAEAYTSTPRGVRLVSGGRYIASASAVNAVRFFLSSGNITSGKFECWGVRA